MITVVLALTIAIVDPVSKPEPVASAAATTALVAAAPAAAKLAADPKRRYCINENLTGTRMAKKVCMTKQEWARRGVDLTD